MNNHLKRSRITKAFADAGLAASFDDAEARLDSVEVCVVLDATLARTPAGQAAALTALATALKSFGRATLACDEASIPLIGARPLGETLGEAAAALGARLEPDCPAKTTHAIHIGAKPSAAPWRIYCWWERWCSGTRLAPIATNDNRVALAGSFAGALAVRQVFAHVRFGKSAPARAATLSLWRPELGGDALTNTSALGPTKFTLPNSIWLLGLGHLGQAAIWTLCLQPTPQGRAVVQDDQFIGEENEPTSLLVRMPDIGVRKARVSAAWLELADWSAAIVERRHYGDIAVRADDPPFLLSGLDDLAPRLAVAKAGFEYMIDVGVGHGPKDFEGIQIRVIPKGARAETLWREPDAARHDQLLDQAAYESLDAKVGACGAYSIAKASVAVPFVGAAAAALAVSQMIRLASGEDAVALLQVDLGAPEMIIDGGRVPAPRTFLGGSHVNLDFVSQSHQSESAAARPDSS